MGVRGKAAIGKLAAVAPLTLLIAAGSTKTIDLPGDRLFPESVSIAPDGTGYVGSMTGGVVRISIRTGRAEQWIKPAAYGSGALFGVLADTRNKLLWTCTNDFSARGHVVPGSDPGSVLKGFNLKSGAGKVSLPLPGNPAICNDMAVGKDGSVYVADTRSPNILRWRPGSKALEVWISDPVLGAANGSGLDGIAFGGDGNLYINNITSGDLFRIEMLKSGKAGKITKLVPSRPLVKPDGMRPLGGMVFALAEGDGHVTRVTVSGDHAEIETLAEGIAGLTGVDMHGETIWYVQGQLSYVLDPAKRSQTPELPFRLTPVSTNK